MNYFLVAAGISVISVLIPTLISASISKNKDYLWVSPTATIIYAMLLWISYWSDCIGIYGPVPFALSIIIGTIISGAICLLAKNKLLPGIAIGIMYLIYILGMLLFGSSDMMHAKEKAGLLGTVSKITELNKVMSPADTAHICLVSEDMAKIKAQDALSEFKITGNAIPGSRYEIGNPTKQYVDKQLWWIFPVEFRGWLKWKEDPQAPGYFRVSAENPFAEAQAVQIDKQGKEIHIKYLNSACWGYLAKRHLRNNGYLEKILMDWTFEPDDNWKPYYTVSIMERKIGVTGYKVTGVLAVDLQTGDITPYKLEELPKWIDRAQPLTIIDTNTKMWGKYTNATWWHNVWKDDMSQKPTEGWFMVYNNNGCQWFSGFTSYNNEDKALTGMMLVDARTQGTIFYKAKGVTEEVAYSTAKSLWSNFDGYEPTELVPYNMFNRLTYTISMTYKGQFKGVSLVSMNNKDINAKGDNLNEALENYSAAISMSGDGRLTPTGEELEILQIEGIVERAGTVISKGKAIAVPFMLEGIPKIFLSTYRSSSPEILMLEKGDHVSLTFMDTKEKIITCKTFDILNIILKNENPTQIRYIKNQEEVGKETDRIKRERIKNTLLESERMKNVDPAKLEEFLKKQK